MVAIGPAGKATQWATLGGNPQVRGFLPSLMEESVHPLFAEARNFTKNCQKLWSTGFARLPALAHKYRRPLGEHHGPAQHRPKSLADCGPGTQGTGGAGRPVDQEFIRARRAGSACPVASCLLSLPICRAIFGLTNPDSSPQRHKRQEEGNCGRVGGTGCALAGATDPLIPPLFLAFLCALCVFVAKNPG